MSRRSRPRFFQIRRTAKQITIMASRSMISARNQSAITRQNLGVRVTVMG